MLGLRAERQEEIELSDKWSERLLEQGKEKHIMVIFCVKVFAVWTGRRWIIPYFPNIPQLHKRI